MKIQKSELAQKLSKLRSIVPKKTTQPVLQGILVKDGCLIANNLELSVKARLEGRGTEDAKVIAKRLKRAYEETDDMVQYDYLVVNDDIDVCVENIHAVIEAESFKADRNADHVKRMKEELAKLRRTDYNSSC